MTDEKTSNATGVGFEMGWSGKGLTAKIESRFVQALDRLGGQYIREKGLARDARIEQSLQRTRHELALRQELFDQQLAAVHSDPVLRARIAARATGDLIREDKNITAVLAHTQSELSRSKVLDEDLSDDSIDEEWLTAFTRLMKDATSERQRTLFGKILAGEILQPGQSSPGTLRVISEMPVEAARVFDGLMPYCFAGKIILDESHGGIKLSYDEQNLMVDCGLMLENTILSSYSELQTEARGIGLIRGSRLDLEVKTLEPQVHLKVVGTRLTKAGQELARVIGLDERSAYRKAIDLWETRLAWAAVGKIQELSENVYGLRPSDRELLWQRDEPKFATDGGA